MWYEVVWEVGDGLFVGIVGVRQLVEAARRFAELLVWLRPVGGVGFGRRILERACGCYYAAAARNAVGLESLNGLFSLKK
jgi:hypothetical protein